MKVLKNDKVYWIKVNRVSKIASLIKIDPIK